MRYFAFFSILSLQNLARILHIILPFKLVTFQVLNSHRWLLALLVLDSTALACGFSLGGDALHKGAKVKLILGDRDLSCFMYKTQI